MPKIKRKEQAGDGDLDDLPYPERAKRVIKRHKDKPASEVKALVEQATFRGLYSKGYIVRLLARYRREER